jgi:hypothetical protein
MPGPSAASQLRELHRRLRADRDEIPVHDCALVDAVVTAGISGGHEVPGSSAGVAAVAQETSSDEPAVAPQMAATGTAASR